MVSDNGVRYDFTQGCALSCLSCLWTGGAGDDGMRDYMVAIERLTLPHAVEHPISLAVVNLLEWTLGLVSLLRRAGLTPGERTASQSR